MAGCRESTVRQRSVNFSLWIVGSLLAAPNLTKKSFASAGKRKKIMAYEPDSKTLIRHPRSIKNQFPARLCESRIAPRWSGSRRLPRRAASGGVGNVDEQDCPPRVLEGRRRAWACRPGLAAADFFFVGAATAEIYTLSLHDALPL